MQGPHTHTHIHNHTATQTDCCTSRYVSSEKHVPVGGYSSEITLQTHTEYEQRFPRSPISSPVSRQGDMFSAETGGGIWVDQKEHVIHVKTAI